MPLCCLTTTNRGYLDSVLDFLLSTCTLIALVWKENYKLLNLDDYAPMSINIIYIICLILWTNIYIYIYIVIRSAIGVLYKYQNLEKSFACCTVSMK